MINPTIANASSNSTSDVRPKFRIGFNAPKIDHRQILLTIDENTSDGFDWGYDAEIYQIFEDDMYWVINDKKYVIQATNVVTVNKEVSLGIITVEGGEITIKVDAIENPIDGLKIGLIDKELNIVYDLEQSDYQVTLPAGEYHNRYAIIFLSTAVAESAVATEEEETATQSTAVDTEAALPPPPPGAIDGVVINSVNEETSSEDGSIEMPAPPPGNFNDDTFHTKKIEKFALPIYVTKGSNILTIKNIGSVKLNNVVLYNKLGQNIQVWGRNLTSKNVKLPINIKSGVYIIQVNTEKGIVSKQIIVNNS